MEKNSIALVTYRGNSIENVHSAHVAVVDHHGTLLSAFGDPSRMTLARSAAKPAQALAVLETDAFERFRFDEADVALMCASHSSEDRHIERVRSMLSKIDAKEADLQCGGHVPISEAVGRAWIKRAFTPTAVCSNCSGKHVGMLAGARALGASIDGYHEPSHPMQRRVKQVVAELCNLSADEIEWAIDGCNLPTPAFPLQTLATIYAKLAGAADIAASVQGATDSRTSTLARIFGAMTAYPELVAGEGRFCTELMNAYDGALVGKQGADGCYGIGVRASDQTERLGASGAVGISVKVEDGNSSIVGMVVMEVLEQLQIGTDQERDRLGSFHRPKMVNTMNREIGHAEFRFELERL